MGSPSAVKAEEGSAMVTLDGCGDRSGPTAIHIHINQESCLTSLWKGVQFIRRSSPPAHKEAGATKTTLTPKDGPRARAGSDGEQKVLGGALILLGAFCVALGVEITRGYTRVVNNFGFVPYRVVLDGTAFWTGSAFIVAGIFSVVGARRGGFWVHVATFFNLASVVTGSVGFVQTLNEIRHFRYFYITDYICRSLERKSYGWLGGTPSYIPDRSWLERCEMFVESFMVSKLGGGVTFWVGLRPSMP
nr:PREDICTED: uncharacterized protein LOC103281578 [Anolis carolinensis]|eukprot:XP_008121654.2 PREDICTED: uncharacterized protein LOC103281578 [Anolis carolinensis]